MVSQLNSKEPMVFLGGSYGNLRALEAVLTSVQKRGIQQIVFLGNALGLCSYPKECIELVLKNCIPVLGTVEGSTFLAWEAGFEPPSQRGTDLQKLYVKYELEILSYRDKALPAFIQGNLVACWELVAAHFLFASYQYTGISIIDERFYFLNEEPHYKPLIEDIGSSPYSIFICIGPKGGKENEIGKENDEYIFSPVINGGSYQIWPYEKENKTLIEFPPVSGVTGGWSMKESPGRWIAYYLILEREKAQVIGVPYDAPGSFNKLKRNFTKWISFDK